MLPLDFQQPILEKGERTSFAPEGISYGGQTDVSIGDPRTAGLTGRLHRILAGLRPPKHAV